MNQLLDRANTLPPESRARLLAAALRGPQGRTPHRAKNTLLDSLQMHSMSNRRDGNTLKNSDGSTSTTRSMSVRHEGLNGGKPTLIPTIYQGREVSYQEAIENALQSGQVWPTFNTEDEATAYSKQASKMMRPLDEVAREMEQSNALTGKKGSRFNWLPL